MAGKETGQRTGQPSGYSNPAIQSLARQRVFRGLKKPVTRRGLLIWARLDSMQNRLNAERLHANHRPQE
jgi:hypothetical protein